MKYDKVQGMNEEGVMDRDEIRKACEQAKSTVEWADTLPEPTVEAAKALLALLAENDELRAALGAAEMYLAGPPDEQSRKRVRRIVVAALLGEV